MELCDYKPTCAFDFELIIDRWVDENKNTKTTMTIEDKENYIKELMLECFRIGFKAGQMTINRPIDLKKVVNGKG